MQVRSYEEEDASVLMDLFRETVHTVCRADYSPAQLEAWAPEGIDRHSWAKRFANSTTFIGDENGVITGFANLTGDGTIDMFYVHKDWQSRGVGTHLMAKLEHFAKEQGLSRLKSDVSLTAKAFFLRKGFHVEKAYTKEARGQRFRNHIMIKSLESSK